MNEPTAGRLVRPWFLGASTVVFVLLIPVLVHSIWDYIELRRLDSLISGIDRSEEPVGPSERIDLAGPAADADRYYRAAAALASGRATKLMSREFATRLSAAERDDVWPPELVAELRSWVDSYEEPLAFADRAAVLPFEGFAAGQTFSYLTADLVTILGAEGYRATVRALSGDADGAAAALFSEAQLHRPLDTNFASVRLAGDVRVVFAHSRPSSRSLGPLAAALAESDRDDEIRRGLIRMRAITIDTRRTQGFGFIVRPWVTHRTIRALTALSEMIRVSDRPWPERIDAVDRAPGFTRPFAEIVAERVALLRVARVAVAVARYEREHGEQTPATLDVLTPAYLPAAPVDPFSGRPLRLIVDARGYTVYSVGRNRRDDGGRDLGQQFAGPAAWPRTPWSADLGIRIERTTTPTGASSERQR